MLWHPAATLMLAPLPAIWLQEYLEKFAPHQGMLVPPEFPSNFIPKSETTDATGIPDKLQFNFFVPHETVCQNEKVDLVLVPAVTGDFGVMPGHVPTVAQLRPGVVTIHKELDKEVQKYFVRWERGGGTPGSCVSNAWGGGLPTVLWFFVSQRTIFAVQPPQCSDATACGFAMHASIIFHLKTNSHPHLALCATLLRRVQWWICLHPCRFHRRRVRCGGGAPGRAGR